MTEPVRPRTQTFDPIERFRDLFDQVLSTGLAEPTAMALATAGADGRPSVRMVLLKDVDLRAFRFSLLEIRNWVEADQSTGRIVHVPCGKILSEPLANFGAGFHWVWHEIPVLVTFESDWERATALLERVLAEESPDVRSREAAEAIRRASKDYLISFTHLTPMVYLDVRDSGILLTGRLLCDVRTRRGVTHRIWTALLKGIEADPGIELAYPTVRAFLADPVHLRSEPPGHEGRAAPRAPGEGGLPAP